MIVRILLWKLWNTLQKSRLADTRALMHRVKFYNKATLDQTDKKTSYKWVIITKEL